MTIGLPELGPDGHARARALAALRLADVAPDGGRRVRLARPMPADRRRAAGAGAGAGPGRRASTARSPCRATRTPDVDRVDGTFVVRGGRPLIRGALGDFAVDAGGWRPQPVRSARCSTPPVDRFDLVVDLGTPPLPATGDAAARLLRAGAGRGRARRAARDPCPRCAASSRSRSTSTTTRRSARTGAAASEAARAASTCARPRPSSRSARRCR